MTDWNKAVVLPLHIGTYSRYGPVVKMRQFTAAGLGASNTWPAANAAAFYPMYIPFDYPVNRVFWVNGATPGNVDFGIYSVSGRKIFSTGSIVGSGASTVQYVSVGSPFILSAGSYYFAWASSGTASKAFGAGLTSIANARGTGILWQTAAFPLPDPATFGLPVASMIYENCGITRTVSGF